APRISSRVPYTPLFRSVVHSLHGGHDLVARHGAGEVAASLDELIARVDVVDVCTPTDTHPEIVFAAAAAGRHVLCEKPLALDPRSEEHTSELQSREKLV